MKLDQTLESESFRLTEHGTEFTVETSLDIGLQNYIIGLLRRSRMYQAAVVALRPDNGQVLAMANYGSHGGEGKENLCLRAGFPAASLFKIVSAAAAIEARGFTPDKSLYFKGKRHTLYKRQLLQSKGRYTVKTSFRKAFARSINPVFGKIGIYVLGRDLIADYADKFLFNHAIPFDLPLAVSRIQVPTDDFGMAEIASGFNRSTVMSPLHAALITSALANNGNMMEPWVTKRIRDESGRIVYRAKLSRLANPIEEETAKSLMVLMEAAVVRGTCSKAFLSLRRKKAFKNIKLGAKTGTINDHSDEYKYDWLTAYAVPNHGKGGICIAVLAVHGEKLGVRAKDLATRIINYHFTS
jgi:cell division protein FtsI/penicillin-binding protein 2